MIIAVLMPVYRRPRLAENAAACFLAQILPADCRAHLLILDDGDTFTDVPPSPAHHSIHLLKSPTRFPNLGAKYNAGLQTALNDLRPDVVALFDEDDHYLPWHLRAHAECLRGKPRAWSKPSRVWSDYRAPGAWRLEDGAGRFHGSIAFTADVAARWPEIPDPDFDQQFMARLAAECGPPCDPLGVFRVPGYCFRWHSGTWHGEQFARFGAQWYERAGEAAKPVPPAPLRPAFDHDHPALVEHLFKIAKESGYGP